MLRAMPQASAEEQEDKENKGIDRYHCLCMVTLPTECMPSCWSQWTMLGAEGSHRALQGANMDGEAR